jgi:hypothetical protein
MAQALSMQRPAFKNVAGTHNGKSRGAVVLRAAQRSQVNDLAQVCQDNCSEPHCARYPFILSL